LEITGRKQSYVGCRSLQARLSHWESRITKLRKSMSALWTIRGGALADHVDSRNEQLKSEER
jgi:hypothetical protein